MFRSEGPKMMPPIICPAITGKRKTYLHSLPIAIVPKSIAAIKSANWAIKWASKLAELSIPSGIVSASAARTGRVINEIKLMNAALP